MVLNFFITIIHSRTVTQRKQATRPMTAKFQQEMAIFFTPPHLPTSPPPTAYSHSGSYSDLYDTKQKCHPVSFLDGKRHLTINISVSLSKQIALIHRFDTSKGILHSSGRFGRRYREGETDSTHKTSSHWQIRYPIGEALTNWRIAAQYLLIFLIFWCNNTHATQSQTERALGLWHPWPFVMGSIN